MNDPKPKDGAPGAEPPEASTLGASIGALLPEPLPRDASLGDEPPTRTMSPAAEPPEPSTLDASLATADDDRSDLNLEALTADLATRRLVELDENTSALVEESPEEPPPDAKSRRKIVLEKAQALVGRVLSDRYKVEEVLAAGGMGCVYRGQHVHMHKRVAIKVLLPDTEGLPDLVLRFKREAVAGAHIDHPNVAAATDFGKLEDGSFFLVQQYVRGITLHDLIKRGPIPPPRAARIMRQIASALAACHQIGVVHRDLKPRNVMLEEDRNDFVKLIDFGLAKVPMDRISTVDAIDAKKGLKVTTMGVVFGTITYMSPEAAFGMDAVDERSDLYALGVMLYEMLAGAHPFESKNPSEIFRMHRTVMPPPIRVRSPGVEVPARLEAIATRLLQKDPKDRYESARAVVAALDAAMPAATLDLAAPSADGSSPPMRLAGVLREPSSSPSPSSKETLPPSTKPATAVDARGPAESGPGTTPSARATPASTPPAGEYIPRLAVRPTPRASFIGRMPRWVIPAVIGAAALAAMVTAVVLLRGDGGGDGEEAGGGGALEAEDHVTALGELAEEAGAALGKAPAPPAGGEAAVLRAQLKTSAEAKEWGRGTNALLTLVDTDPKAFEEREVINAAVAVAAGIMVGSDERANKVFDALTNKLGSAGLDVLYDIESTRGGSKAAKRASETLRQEEVLARVSPALKIAIELRDGTCKERLALLDRAKAEGDRRAIAVLDILRNQKCVSKSKECCFRTNGAVEDTTKQIWARLRASP